MKITTEWLDEKSACEDGKRWFNAQTETDAVKILEKLIAADKLAWANWTICQLFTRKQQIQYAAFAAEQVIDIFEKEYPADTRPREAIETAKKYLNYPTQENRDAAVNAATNAVNAASDATYAAYAAANVANADTDAHSVNAAINAYVAYAAANADTATYATKNAIKIKILKYGIELLRQAKAEGRK